MTTSISSIDADASALIQAARQDLAIGARVALHGEGPTEVPIRTVIDPHTGVSTVEVARDILAATDERGPAPKRRTTRHAFAEVDSLIQYVQRFGGPNTIVYANPATFAVEAVLNDHPSGEHNTDAAWRDHRATYTCPRSSEWLAWTDLDGKAMTQEKFADFIESRLEDLVSGDGMPSATDVLTMARNLNMRTKGTFERSLDPTTGNSSLVNKTETDTGSTVIPRAFLIGIPVFDGGERYRVEARVRLEIKDGKALFLYVLHRRKEIERDAFGAVRAQIATETGRAVLAGTP